MINLYEEDYFIEYSQFLAEMELFESELLYSNLLEEVSTVSLLEADKESTNQYIKKVCDSAQQAWTNFRNKVATKDQVKKLKSYAPNIAGPKAKQLTFRIDNYPVYNINALTEIKVKPFVYMNMKENCGSQRAYLKAYAPKLVTGKGTRIYSNYKALVKRNNTTVVMDNNNVLKLFNFCYRDFYNYRNSIANDIEAINRSGSSVLGLASEGLLFDPSDLELLSEKSLMNLNKIRKISNQQSSKMTYTATNGKQITDADMKGASYSKAIQVYLKCNLSIISTKMKILRRIYEDYFNIIEHYNVLATSTNTIKPNIKIKK